MSIRDMTFADRTESELDYFIDSLKSDISRYLDDYRMDALDNIVLGIRSLEEDLDTAIAERESLEAELAAAILHENDEAKIQEQLKLIEASLAAIRNIMGVSNDEQVEVIDSLSGTPGAGGTQTGFPE